MLTFFPYEEVQNINKKVAVIKSDNRGPSIWEGHELAD